MNQPAITDQITFIYTVDIEKSAHFYQHQLGLTMTLDQGGCRVYHVTGNAYLGVCQRRSSDIHLPPPDKRSVIVTLVTNEVDEWYQKLTASGVAFESKPAANPTYGIYHAFLRDPSGYLIEIQRFDNPDWNR
jgi:catechol 2,3-dioxygenase-like lactoylglutathione lyase family enzyme